VNLGSDPPERKMVIVIARKGKGEDGNIINGTGLDEGWLAPGGIRSN